VTVRAPTLAELVALIRSEADAGRRAQLEAWYWAKETDRVGVRRARWYREEYEWLRSQAS